jgi:hypothetical protein
MNTLAIDPGNRESAWVVVDETCRPLDFGKLANDTVLGYLPTLALTVDRVAIEWVSSYGMAVGADVFDTCRWVGRFQQELDRCGMTAELVYRRDVKLHLCHSARAKDPNITQALVDRFAHGEPNRGKGTKAKPGWFFGFSADIWQAYALAVTVVDCETT